jgi:hypothetical protein
MEPNAFLFSVLGLSIVSVFPSNFSFEMTLLVEQSASRPCNVQTRFIELVARRLVVVE